MHHRLGREPLTLGKSPRCDLSLPERAIARRQADIVWQDGRHRLVDRSGQKTALNGQPVDEAWLADGDYLDCGIFRVHFHDVELEEPAELVTAVRTLVAPSGKPAPLPDEIVVTAQRPAGGKAVHVPLGPGPLDVGSGEGCGLRIDDPLVSALHGRLTRHPRGVCYADVGSTNGSFLHGIDIFEAILPLGERLRLGGTDVWVAPPKQALEQAASFEGILTEAPAMFRLFERLVAIAAADGNVRIHGETGVGKDLVARAIHARSRRARGPFIPFNCTGVTESLVESVLFGHEKGAFSGAVEARDGLVAAADGGTLFLDEIGDMRPEVQVRLLRTVETGEILRVGADRPRYVDVRFIAGSHRDLHALAAAGRFREDLLFRLNVLPVEVPPLRQRLGDIPLLWKHFAGEFAIGGTAPELTPALVERLRAHRWPGNVRELRTLVERTLCLMTRADLSPDDLQFDPEVAKGAQPLQESAGTPGLTLDEVKRITVRAALQRHRGNRSHAAAELGIDRTTLQRQIAAYGFEREGLREEEEGE